MKKILNFTILFALVLITSHSSAQGWAVQKNRQPRWISEKGFWQVQSNIQSPRKNTVYFFNNDKVLIYQEQINGIKLDLKKTKVRMRLKKALEAAVLAWETDRIPISDRQLVRSVFE